MGIQNNSFYLVKFPPSPEEHEKEEAEKQYHFMNLARLRIADEIANLKTEEHQINQKIMKFSYLDDEIEQIMRHIKNQEHCVLGKVEPALPFNSVPRTTGFLHLPQNDERTIIIPDRKRCQKRLIMKGRMDINYLQQLQEQLLCAKKCIGMTSCGTQELNDMIKSMLQRIQHGNKKQGDEMKIYQEISNLKETKEIYNAPEPIPYRDHWYTRERKSKVGMDWKRATEHWINIRLDDIEQLRRQQIGRKSRVARHKAELEYVRKKISPLEKELETVNKKRLEAYKRVQDLEEQKKGLNSSYSEYQSLMRYAKELIRKGDVMELKQVRDKQVEEFMRQWNDDKAFREDYVKSKLVWHG